MKFSIIATRKPGDYGIPDLPLFFKAFFLDAVAGASWECRLVIDHHNQVVAVMPLAMQRGFVLQPPLTIYQGPWFTSLGRKLSTSLQFDILEELCQSLESLRYYNQNWHPEMLNWLPFYWHGFTQSTRYTYTIAPDSPASIWSGYNENVRRNIRKAQREFRVVDQVSGERFVRFVKSVYASNVENPFRLPLLQHLVEECYRNSAGKVIELVDENTRCFASIFVGWDAQSVYYLAGAYARNQSGNQAMTLLMHEAISWAATQGKTFDFEGSMIRSIEKYFRSFGAKQRPYFVLTRAKGLLLRGRLLLGRKVPWLLPGAFNR